MEKEEQSKTGEPLSLSQILLSTNNPFASSTKDKSSPEQEKSRKRPVGPTSNYEFVRIVAETPEKYGRHKEKKRLVDVGSTNKTEVPSSPQESSLAMEKAIEVEASLSPEHPSFIEEVTPSDVTQHFYMDKSSSEQSMKMLAGPTFKYEFVGRVADNPEKHRRHKKTKRIANVGSTKKKKFPSQQSSLAMERAKEVEASLSHEHPSFTKAMTPSNVTDHFYMRFPREFSILHLPTDEEALVVLEDEKGKQYKTKYLPQWYGLSAGWKHFTVAKSLRVNDVLVFLLVQPCKFKVYILRTDDFDPVDKDVLIRKPKEIILKKKRASEKPKEGPMVVTNVSQEDVEANNSTTENHNSPATTDVRFSKTISSFRNFNIIVDNKTIDSEIHKHIRTSYVIMCRTQRTSLHRHLVKGIDRKLAASIISETTNIADAITNSEMSTPRDDIAYWNTALQSFEFLGMDVGFIRARLDRLLGIARECSKAITDAKKSKNLEVESKVSRIEEDIKKLKNKIEELKLLKIMVEMRENESMEEIVEKFKVMYKAEAKAPW